MWCCSSRFDGETVALGLFSTGPGFYISTLGYPILIDLHIILGTDYASTQMLHVWNIYLHVGHV